MIQNNHPTKTRPDREEWNGVPDDVTIYSAAIPHPFFPSGVRMSATPLPDCETYGAGPKIGGRVIYATSDRYDVRFSSSCRMANKVDRQRGPTGLPLAESVLWLVAGRS